MPLDRVRSSPTQTDIDWLIGVAERHPLGLDYLQNGHLGTVAITFGCHAFTVVAARDFLNGAGAPARSATRHVSSERAR